MFRRRLAIALVALLVVGGYGIWRLTIPDRPVALIVDAEMLRCPIPYPIGPLQSPPTATVPHDFIPVVAVTCDPFVSDEVSADRTVGFSEHRWVGDFSRAVNLLNRSSEHTTLFPGGCGDNYSIAMLDAFWLVDNRGRAVRPGYPSDSCGLPKPGGLAALKELSPVGSTEQRILLSDDQIRELSNCSPSYRLPTAGTQAVPTPLPVGGTYCRFSSDEFVGTRSTTVTIDGLVPAPACDVAATEVASTMYTGGPIGQQQLVTVEIDGCRRVIVDGYAPLQATKELSASLR